MACGARAAQGVGARRPEFADTAFRIFDRKDAGAFQNRNGQFHFQTLCLIVRAEGPIEPVWSVSKQVLPSTPSHAIFLRLRPSSRCRLPILGTIVPPSSLKLLGEHIQRVIRNSQNDHQNRWGLMVSANFVRIFSQMI